MSAETRVVGRCFCGAVRFLVTLPPKFCVHCHCRHCRRLHGTALVTWFGVPSAGFRLAGREHLKWYIASAVAKRGFCDICGTPMLFMSTQFPGDVHVARACVVGNVDIEPRFHIYYDQHVSWFSFADALPRLGGRTGTEPLAADPDGGSE